MDESLLQHYVGKTIKIIETDEPAGTMYIEFTDGHNMYLESFTEMEMEQDEEFTVALLDITINSYSTPVED